MYQLIERLGAHRKFQRQLFGFGSAGFPVCDFPFVLFNSSTVFLGADHPIAKQYDRRLNTPPGQSNCFLFLLFKVLIILISSVGFVHLDCQLSHEDKGLRANGE
ncbi:MAG: hypothetical protein Kow0077_22750 [Anaerolineae bacterium]